MPYLIALKPFIAIWGLLLAMMFIHIGYINCKWKFWHWPEATFYVAFRDQRTRNDFWHIFIDTFLLAAVLVLGLFLFGILHYA